MPVSSIEFGKVIGSLPLGFTWPSIMLNIAGANYSPPKKLNNKALECLLQKSVITAPGAIITVMTFLVKFNYSKNFSIFWSSVSLKASVFLSLVSSETWLKKTMTVS